MSIFISEERALSFIRIFFDDAFWTLKKSLLNSTHYKYLMNISKTSLLKIQGYKKLLVCDNYRYFLNEITLLKNLIFFWLEIFV